MGKLNNRNCAYIIFSFIFIFCFLFYAQVAFTQSSSSGQEAYYIGVDKCKTCHPQQYQDFSQRRFNKAWKVLKMRGEDKNPECLKCHVTGYGKMGGFISEEQTPGLANKQCESCHGPGARHASNPSNSEYRQDVKKVSKESKENVCIECHLCMKTHRAIEF